MSGARSTVAATARYDGVTAPDLDAFRVLAATRRVIPVTRRVLADGETALSLYRKLAGSRPGTFLLESSADGGLWSRYSFIGAGSLATLTEKDGQAHWIGTPPAGVPVAGDPVVALRDTLRVLGTPRLPGLPPLTGGMIGFIGWEAVRRWEDLPGTPPRDVPVPEIALQLSTELAVLDHRDGSLTLIAVAINVDDTPDRVDEAWAGAVARLDRMAERLAAPAPSTVSVADQGVRPSPEHRRDGAEFLDSIARAKDAIRDGEVFQVVLSQRFDLPCPGDPIDVYRVLRAGNPSPYMYAFCLQDPDGGVYWVVGSSPEALVKVTGDEIVTHPIAGSRPRGATPEEDSTLAAELLADPKERAEHLMLVDLSRNDLSKVCVPGSVSVVEFMNVQRYSHIMHLESNVTGRLRPGLDAYDALAATFPAGTLSGAPKPRALRLIDSLEPHQRGVYGGVVGYLDFAGDMDMAIAIRTALIRDGWAHVQAGAGIVADSVPESEVAESENKAAAPLRAVAVAATLRGAGAAAGSLPS